MSAQDWGPRGRPRSARELLARWRSELADEAHAAVVHRGEPQPLHDLAADMLVDAGALREVLQRHDGRLTVYRDWAWRHDRRALSWVCDLATCHPPPPRRAKPLGDPGNR